VDSEPTRPIGIDVKQNQSGAKIWKCKKLLLRQKIKYWEGTECVLETKLIALAFFFVYSIMIKYKFGYIFGLTPNYLIMTQHAMCSFAMKLHEIFDLHQLILEAKQKQLKGAKFIWELIHPFLSENCPMTTGELPTRQLPTDNRKLDNCQLAKLSTGTTTNRTVTHALQKAVIQFFFLQQLRYIKQNMPNGLKFLAWRKCKNVWVFEKQIYCLNICLLSLALATKLSFLQHCCGSVQKLRSWTWYGSTIEQSCSFVFGIHTKRKGVLTRETI